MFQASAAFAKMGDLCYTISPVNSTGNGRVQFVVNDTAKKVFRKGGKGKLSGKCDVCGKTPGFGHNVSHSARKTNRMWMPNIQHKMVQLKGETAPVRRNVCTQCLRTLQKDRV